LSDRLGCIDTFSLEGNKVVGTLRLLRASKLRDAILESAETTPDLLGLSLDFEPVYEVRGDRALLRIVSVGAVDSCAGKADPAVMGYATASEAFRPCLLTISILAFRVEPFAALRTRARSARKRPEALHAAAASAGITRQAANPMGTKRHDF